MMSIAIRGGLLLLLAVVVVMQIVASKEKGQTIAQISQTDLITRIKEQQPILILDVRTKEEYGAGHIPRAINIDFKELKNRIGEIDSFKHSSVVVYCERGVRAKIAELTLQQAGFQSIFHPCW